MAQRIREHDWASTPLGPIERWPERLRAAVDLMLPSAFATVVLWGPELIQMYNDAYRALMGARHPTGLGQPAHDCWPEFRERQASIYDRVLSGETVSFDDAMYPIALDGPPDDAWFILSFSPLRNDAGAIAGVLAAAVETTERKRRDASEALLSEISRELVGLTSISETYERLGEAIGTHFGVQQSMFAELVDDAELAVVAHGWHAPGAQALFGRYRMRDFLSDDQLAQYNSGVPSIVSDTQEDARVSAESYGALGIRSFIIVPLVRAGHWQFLFSVIDNKVRSWREDEIALAREIAERVWLRLEQARVEEAFRESEARLRHALDANQLGTFVWFPQEDRTEADARLLTQFGVPSGGSINLAKALAHMIHPDDRDAYAQAIVEATDPTGNGILYAELRVIHPDESLHWIAITGQTVFEGNPPHAERMYGTSAGITERKVAEAIVLADEERRAFLLVFEDALRPLADPLDIQRTAMQLLCEWFGALRALYADIDPDGDGVTTIEVVENSPFPVPVRHRISDFAPWMAAAFAAGETVAVEDVNTDPRIDDAGRPAYRTLGTESAVAVPLIKDGRFVAAVIINYARPRHWPLGDLRLLEEVADRTWAAVERAQAEQALRASEKRYRTLFDSIDQGFCTIEVLFDDGGQPIDYRFLEINPSFARNTGLANALGQQMRELAPAHEEYWFRIYGEVALTQVPVRFEAEAAALGRWFNISAYPTGNPDDRQIAVLFEDITERRTAVTALQESELRFRTLVQNLPDYAIFLLDPDGCVAEWSEGAERITGYTTEEAVGQHISLLYSEEAKAAGLPEDELAMAASTGRVEHEGWLIQKDGERFWGSEIVTAIHGPAGTLLGFTKIARDLTERRQYEEKLLDSEERIRAIIETATDYAIFTVDKDGLIQDWFSGAEAVFGWSAADAIGQPIAITFSAEDRALGIPEQELQQARQANALSVARWRQHKNGSRIYIESVIRARYDLDGVFLGVFRIGRDATEQHLSVQRRIEREEQARHELRNRVAAATRQLRTLSRRLLIVQEEERRFLARELHDEIGQMLTGLSFTLSSATVSKGQLAEAQRIVAELTEQVRQLSMDLRPAALDAYGLLPALHGHIERFETRTGVMVDLRTEGLENRFPAPVEITAYRIVQEALTNLARHAEVSEATVQLLADDAMLAVSIRDGGRGFDPERAHDGSGLGGMRERAELLGGSMEIETAPGAGVRLTAELPLAGPATTDLTEERVQGNPT